METLEIMDVYAMDRGICRITARMVHPEFNPVCNKRYKSLGLNGRFDLTNLGIGDKKTSSEVEANILSNHRRINDWPSYQHNLECLVQMLFEYEQTTQRPHSHDAILPCLQRRVAEDLNFSDEKISVTNHHPRWKMIGNYLASQMNRSFSGLVRDWGVHEPDSYPFLEDEIYRKAATHWSFTSEVFGTRTGIN